VGKRLPGLKALVNNPYTPWQTVEMKDWYGQGDSCTSPQQPQFGTKLGCQLPIRWVLIKDPKGSLNPSAPMHGLDGHASSNLAMVSLSLAGRSHFEEARAHLGLNLNVNGHRDCPHAPCATALFSIVTVAHQQTSASV